MKLIPDPAPAKPDDRAVWIPGARWRPEPWDGKPIRGMGALHAAREEDRFRRRERRLVAKLTLTQRGATVRRRDDGTTFRYPLGDYPTRTVPLVFAWTALTALFARRGCRHNYAAEHYAAATWDFEPFYEGGGSWHELIVPLRILCTRNGRLWLALPAGRPEIVTDST